MIVRGATETKHAKNACYLWSGLTFFYKAR